MASASPPHNSRIPLTRSMAIASIAVSVLLVAAVLVWQAAITGGSPDPAAPHTSRTVAILDIAVLVFREGLECTLVLSAITAGLRGTNAHLRRPIGAGASVGAIATVATWLIAVRIMNALSGSVSALALQAWTGLLAIVVLLVVMNWFFHGVYWTGWISFQNRTKRSLLQSSTTSRVLLGLGLLGFASFYREGFEVVLFLQSYRLQMGEDVVLMGALLGVILSGIVAILTFVGQRHLPYKKMLIVTGVMLAGVLFIMVGEQAFEMQQAGWIGTSAVSWLRWIPSWAGMWFSIFPNWETIVAQAVAMSLVFGSYALARHQVVTQSKKKGREALDVSAAPSPEPLPLTETRTLTGAARYMQFGHCQAKDGSFPSSALLIVGTYNEADLLRGERSAE